MIKKIAFYFSHPSHFYCFKYILYEFQSKNVECRIYIKEKDVLEKLLISENHSYEIISPKREKNSTFFLIKNVLTKNLRLLDSLKDFGPDFLLSCASDVSQVGKLLRIPSFILNDDDANIVKKSALFGWPFSTVLFAPQSCSMGYWQKKTVFYYGFQKLAYLHPNVFEPSEKVLENYNLKGKNYFLIRSVSLVAHHDKNIRGLNNKLVSTLIKMLKQYGDIYISSEKPLPPELEPYRLDINPIDIHHVIKYSKLLIGDSQSMAHEAAMLGTPSIRFNDFVGRIGVLEELEHEFGLTFGIKPDNEEKLISMSKKLAEMSIEDSTLFEQRSKELIKKSVDLSSLLVWFMENWPKSVNVLKDDPSFQNKFK